MSSGPVLQLFAVTLAYRDLMSCESAFLAGLNGRSCQTGKLNAVWAATMN
jgi:hypothetical protein